MHFSYKSVAAIITAASSIHVCGGSPSSRTDAETTRLQFTDESAEDFLLKHFYSNDNDLAESNIEFRKIAASSHECLKRFTNGHELGAHSDNINIPLVPDDGLILSSGNPYNFASGVSDEQGATSSTDWHSEGDDELTDFLQKANPDVYTNAEPSVIICLEISFGSLSCQGGLGGGAGIVPV